MDITRRHAATARLLTRARPEPQLGSEEVEQLASRVQAALPRYTLGEPLGRGGSSVVFTATEERLGREVALKVFVALPGSEPAARERFAREARAMAGLAHSNVVVIHDFGQSDDLDWIAMERIEGVTLRQVLQDGPLDPDEFEGMALPLLDCIEFAHSRGVIHRDIKPENILIDLSGHLKVCDFGIAKWADSNTRWLTNSGVALGTPRYIAPEQSEAPETIDERADIFALGVVLYEMLTGEVPAGHFEPPSECGWASRELDSVVLRAMSRQRANRQDSVAQLRTELMAVLFTATHSPRPSLASPSTQDSLWIDSKWRTFRGDFFALCLVLVSFLIPVTKGSRSIFEMAPVAVLPVIGWFVCLFLSLIGGPWLKPVFVHISRLLTALLTGIGLVVFASFALNYESELESVVIIPLLALAALSAWRFVSSLQALTALRPARRRHRSQAQESRQKKSHLKMLKVWESSGAWDLLCTLLGLLVFLPGLHEGDHLLKEAPIWVLIPIVSVLQVIGVASSQESGSSAGAASWRLICGAVVTAFVLLWGMVDGPDDMEAAGKVVAGLLFTFGVCSVVSGVDWLQRLHALDRIQDPDPESLGGAKQRKTQ